jgi:uncharacterized membrane protein YbhN (UPF0104 family)
VAETPPPAPSPWRARLIVAARYLTIAVVAYFIVATTVSQWADVRETFRSLSWGVVILSTLAAVGSIAAVMMGWRSILADLGHPVPVRAAAQINLVGSLGKYVPGSVWAYVLQMQLGRRFGVPRSRGFLASLVLTLIGISSGVLVGSLGLRSMSTMSGPDARTGRYVMWAALALVPVVVAYTNPWVLSRLVGLALRITRREPLERPFSARGLAITFGWGTLGYVFAGLHLWLLAGTVTGTGVRGLVICSAAMALAIIAGTVAFVLPSGLGVRELVISGTLAGVGVPGPQAFALALVSRLLMTVADVGGAGIATAVALRKVGPAAQSQTAE